VRPEPGSPSAAKPKTLLPRLGSSTRDQMLLLSVDGDLLFTWTPLVCILYRQIHSLLPIRLEYLSYSSSKEYNYYRYHKQETPSKLPPSNRIPSSTTTNMASNGQTSRAPSKCVGPEYKSDKPTATVSTEIPHENVHILPQTPQLISLLTYVLLEVSHPLECTRPETDPRLLATASSATRTQTDPTLSSTPTALFVCL
jgi:hypothetical protein